MYCWRGRVGLLAPSRGDTMIYEFYRVAPDGVTVVPYILNLAEINRDTLTAANEAYEHAVLGLTTERVDLIYLGGLAPLTVLGMDRYTERAARLRSVTTTPIITAVEAEIGAQQRSRPPGSASWRSTGNSTASSIVRRTCRGSVGSSISWPPSRAAPGRPTRPMCSTGQSSRRFGTVISPRRSG